MCNRERQNLTWNDYLAAMHEADLNIPEHQSELDLQVAEADKNYEVGIGDRGVVMVPEGDLVALQPMKFGQPEPGRAPIFNFKSEGRRFGNSRRCVIPASQFYEFTGKKSPKAKHEFSMTGAPIFGIAGVWWPGEGNNPGAFAMLTTSPGPDILPYHDRQIVLLRPAAWKDWLYLTRPEKELLVPAPAGTLEHRLVRAEGVRD